MSYEMVSSFSFYLRQILNPINQIITLLSLLFFIAEVILFAPVILNILYTKAQQMIKPLSPLQIKIYIHIVYITYIGI